MASLRSGLPSWLRRLLSGEGQAYAWGGNEYGQCGEEPGCKDDTSRPFGRDILIPQRCAPKLVVRQVAAGGTHSVVLTREGHVWTWGHPWPRGDIKQISTPV